MERCHVKKVVTEIGEVLHTAQTHRTNVKNQKLNTKKGPGPETAPSPAVIVGSAPHLALGTKRRVTLEVYRGNVTIQSQRDVRHPVREQNVPDVLFHEIVPGHTQVQGADRNMVKPKSLRGQGLLAVAPALLIEVHFYRLLHIASRIFILLLKQ